MKKGLLLAFFASLAFGVGLFGQQDPMLTKYMFNRLAFNPASAGSNEHLSMALVHRQQWLGVEGAPVTQTFNVHSPLRNERVALGFSFANDQIGAMGITDLAVAYTYRFPLGEKLKLAAGLQIGMANWRGNWSSLSLREDGDVAFQDNLSRWLPNFGAGLQLYNERFYIGFGCPRLLEYNLRKADAGQTPIFAKTYRHYYTSVGFALPLGSENLVFRPTALLKSTGWFSSFRSDAAFEQIGSPTELDLDAALFFQKTFLLGLAYRTAFESGSSHDSMDFWAAVYLRNGLRLGAAYDLTLSELQQVSNGSFELMLGYEFDIKVKKVATPRYF